MGQTMTATSFNQRTIDEFHAKKGLGVGPWRDNLLLMTSKGAHTSQEITTPLVYRHQGNDCVVVASKGGAPNHPLWYRNIQANPLVEVEVAFLEGTERFQARAKVLPNGPERDRLFAYMTEVWPAFSDYAARTQRLIPVVVLERQGLIGAPIK
jgi:deazaflavin-dependent oxidoreductase (nitroreductase family)